MKIIFSVIVLIYISCCLCKNYTTEDIKEMYVSNSCASKIRWEKPNPNGSDFLLQKLIKFFGTNDEFTLFLLKFFDDDTHNISEAISLSLSKIIPFIVLLSVLLLSWIVQCACCFFPCCPPCKISEEKMTSPTFKYIPLILFTLGIIIFIIPSLFSNITLINTINSFFELQCYLADYLYMLKTGYSMTTDMIRWQGKQNSTHFHDLFKSFDFTNGYKDIIDKKDELRNKLETMKNTLKASLDNEINNGKGSSIINPIITNKDYSEHKDTFFWNMIFNPDESAYDISDSYFNDQEKSEYFYDTFIKKIYYKYTKLYNELDILSEILTFILKYPDEIDNLLIKIDTLMENTITLETVMSNLLSIIDDVKTKFHSVLITIQVALFISQIIAFILGLVSIGLIYFKLSGKLKYLSHSAWCLSSFNLILCGILILSFFLVGYILINIALLFNNISYKLIDSTGHKWANGMNYANVVKDTFGARNELNTEKVIDELSILAVKLNIYLEKDMFSQKDFFVYINENYIHNIKSTSKVFKEGDLSQNLINLINDIANYKSNVRFPYQVVNDCPKPYISYEIQFEELDCKLYPLMSPIISEKGKKGNYCFLIKDLNNDNMNEIFKNSLTCQYTNGRIYDTELFTDLYDEFITSIDIAQHFYSDFIEWRNYTGQYIVDYTQSIYDFVNENKNYLSELKAKFIVPISNAFGYSVEDVSDVVFSLFDYETMNTLYKKSTDDLYRTAFDYYFFCQLAVPNMYSSDYIDDIVAIAIFKILPLTYKVIICNIILVIYFLIISIFGEMTTLVNFRESKVKKE